MSKTYISHLHIFPRPYPYTLPTSSSKPPPLRQCPSDRSYISMHRMLFVLSSYMAMLNLGIQMYLPCDLSSTATGDRKDFTLRQFYSKWLESVPIRQNNLAFQKVGDELRASLSPSNSYTCEFCIGQSGPASGAELVIKSQICGAAIITTEAMWP